jgi:molecular chaperone GrpE
MIADESQNKENKIEPEVGEQEDVGKLRQTLAEEKAKAERYLANWQRAQADYINCKRQSEQEKDDIRKFANSAFVCSLLPILDDLERAFASLPPDSGSSGWLDGFKLIERKLRTMLETQGVCQIKAVGEAFDPHLHEAVRRGKGKEGIIIEEVQKGYKLNDRVIRPSGVVVGMGEEPESKEG